MRTLALVVALACATRGVWSAGTSIAARRGSDARRVAAQQIEVPIKQTVFTGGGIRYSVPVKIGNANPIDAALDTGSTGLSVLRAAVPEQAYVASGQSSIHVYASGLRLVGVIARAVVSIGEAGTDKPIPIEVVKSADCTNRLPQCEASLVSAADYRIGGPYGLAGQGYYAIVGVSMGNGDAVNPLVHFGAHSWIMNLPRPGEGQPGTLIINPDSDDRTGYTLFHTDKIMRRLPGGFHDGIAGCLTDGSAKRICAPTLLDTGAPKFLIESANAADLSAWKAGRGMEIAFKNGSDAELSTTVACSIPLPALIGRPTRRLCPTCPTRASWRARLPTSPFPFSTMPSIASSA